MRVAFYLRRSTEEHQQDSLETQRDNATRFVADRGWSVVATFEDSGISRDEFVKRPGLWKLLDGAKRGDFDAVVVRDQTRIGGDMARTMPIIVDLAECVRLFYYANGQEVQAKNAMQKMMLAFSGFTAETEREGVTSRTREALKTKAEKGYVTGGRVFGYDNVREPTGDGRSFVRSVVNEAQALIIREMFERKARGEGLKAIAKALNERGVPSPRGRGWAPSAIREMLRNEKYVGVYVWGRFQKGYRGGTKVRTETDESTRLRFPTEELRIIPDDLWTAVQATFRQPAASALVSEKKLNRGGRPAVNLLSTTLRCGECGGPMKVRTHKIGTEKVNAYACSNYAVGRCDCKNSMRRPVDVVNQTVVDWLLADVLREENASAVLDEVERVLVAKAKADGGNVAALKKEAAHVCLRIEKLTEAIIEAPSDVRTPLYTKLRDAKSALASIEERAREAARTPAALRAQLQQLRSDAVRRLALFHQAITTSPALARRLIAAAFPKGIVASPVVRGKRRRFWLSGEASIGVLFSGDTGGPTGIPNVASPTGFEPVLAA